MTATEIALAALTVFPEPVVCPECGSDDTDHKKMRGDACAFGDVDFDECNACGHQWGHS